MNNSVRAITTLTLGLIAVMIVACGSADDGGVAAPSNPTAVPTSTPTAVTVPPLPTIDILVGHIRYSGEIFGYCWPEQNMPEHVESVCADPPFGVFRGPDVFVPADIQPRVFVDAVTAPEKLSAMVFIDPSADPIDLLNLSSEAARKLDIDFADAERLYMRVHGEWDEGAVDYGFWLVRVPDDEPFTADCTWTEIAPQSITYRVLSQETPTAFDGINSAICTFSKPVWMINVTLAGNFGSVHNQSFNFDDPRMEIPFPLDKWHESESTAELLAPGTYERRMAAISTIGEEWVITDHIDAALDEVTVVESSRATPMPTQEWNVEDVSVEGSTVRVTVRVFATTDITVVIDGKEADEVEFALPLIHYVFNNVESGTRELTITDIVGFAYGQPLMIP